MASLEGKRVWITGASSGVGLAAAETFAKHGCDVAVSARSVDGLEKAAASVRRYGRRALVLPLDITEQDRLDAAVARIEEEWGGLDIVPKEDFDRVIEISFIGMTNTVRAALPALERTAGSIVATGSLMSKIPHPTWSSYSASKWAGRSFLHTLRVELQAAGSPVTVSQVHPGAIDTPVYASTPSALGRGPRHPPEGYHPSAIAEALVGMAKKPRAEITVGAEAKALELIWTTSQQAGDLVMRAMYFYFMSGKQAGSDTSALFNAAGKGVMSGDIIGRPSFTLPLRLATLPLRLLR
jgi:NAD(P)-dependent dehydrogenase (short-subunit alcohol dehydrogenase family)